jgi:hypothetical protein
MYILLRLLGASSKSDQPRGSLLLPPVVMVVTAKVSDIEQLGDK